MTKGSSRFSKFYSSSSSNDIEEKILIDPETQIMITENDNAQATQSTDEQSLQRSQSVITKLFKSTIKSKFFNQKSKSLDSAEDKISEGEDAQSNHLPSSNSMPTVVALPLVEPEIDGKSTLSDGFKLKGILKKARRSYSQIDRTEQPCANYNDFHSNQNCLEKRQTANSNENSYDSLSMNNNFDSISSTSSSPTTTKSVKFSDVIFKVKYTTTKSMSSLAKLSTDKRRRFTMFEKSEQLNFDYMTVKELDPLENSIDLLRFQNMNFHKSNTNGLSYDD